MSEKLMKEIVVQKDGCAFCPVAPWGMVNLKSECGLDNGVRVQLHLTPKKCPLRSAIYLIKLSES